MVQAVVVIDDAMAADRLYAVPAGAPFEVGDRDRLVAVRGQQQPIRIPSQDLFQADLRPLLREVLRHRLPTRGGDYVRDEGLSTNGDHGIGPNHQQHARPHESTDTRPDGVTTGSKSGDQSVRVTRSIQCASDLANRL